MSNSRDVDKELAAYIAASLITAPNQGQARDLLNGELARELTCKDKEREHQGDLSAAALPGKRVAAWIAHNSDEGEYFVRSAEFDPENLYAKTEYIPPKSSKLRVVLIGESVARGFLLDPYFNCAVALQECLNLAVGADEIEVIDLAQNGLTYTQLLNLTESALALIPDVFVIFAGNNWRSKLSIETDTIAKILRVGQNWQVVVEYIKEMMRQAVQTLVDKLNGLSTKHSVPIVFIIPEINMLDWPTSPDWRNPLLTGLNSNEWGQLKIEAEKSLALRDYAKSVASSRAMIDLDGGTSPAPYEMLAACSHLLGNNTEARQFMERAIDISLCLPIPTQPRCFPVIREALRAECSTYAIPTVDLPARFSEYLSGSLPDRKLFLDHCHMTIDGIRMAMAHTAECLLPLLGRRKLSWHELNNHQLYFDPHAIAQAHFGAAVINALNGQSYEVVRYHFGKAIGRSSEILDLVSIFVDFTVRKTPYMMCRAFEVFLSKRNIFPSISFLVGRTPSQRSQFNFVEIQAIKDVAIEIIEEAGKRIEELTRSEHAVQVQEINLLNPPYCAVNAGQLEYEWWEGSIYLQARKPRSHFYLICNNPCAIKLELTCRLRYRSLADGPVSLMVNDRLIAKLRVSTGWSRHTLVVPAENFYSGLNSLVIFWPEPQQSTEDRIEEIIKSIEANGSVSGWHSLPGVYTIYGEVHALSAAAQLI